MQAPSSSNARGVDVSHYQGVIDWQQVRAAGYVFAFVKATEGSGMVDDRLISNVQGAQLAGLAIGAYHFLRANTVVGAQREADAYLEAISGLQLDLPPVVDVETIDATARYDVIEVARAWIDRVKARTGKQPILYTYPAFAQNWLSDGRLADVPLWYAFYSGQPADAAGWSRWAFLQTTDSGRVPGIDGPVDLDIYEGSEWDLIGYKMSVDDADKQIGLLQEAYKMGITKITLPNGTVVDVDRDEIHRLANVQRKASGQPEE